MAERDNEKGKEKETKEPPDVESIMPAFVLGVTPDELEYVAEKDLIGIVPHFNLEKMNLIGGDIGPFQAGLPLSVPFWVAANLCSRNKCQILVPDWFDEDVLKDLRDKELAEETFVKMPSEHYLVISKALFELCPGDIGNADFVKDILKDIYDTRMAKLKTSVTAFLGGNQTVGMLANLTMMELHAVRPFFPQALEQIYRLTKTLNDVVTAQPDSQIDDSNTLSMTMSASYQTEADSEGIEGMNMDMDVEDLGDFHHL